MGEARYYLKAVFPTDITSEQLTTIQDFFLEGQDAEDWWQTHRFVKDQGQHNRFWYEFKQNFPLVTELIHDLIGGDCNNDLAGRLDFGDTEDTPPPTIGQKPNEVLYDAIVWHYADWTPLCKFLKSHFGATAAGWLSDEYICDLSQLIEMT